MAYQDSANITDPANQVQQKLDGDGAIYRSIELGKGHNPRQVGEFEIWESGSKYEPYPYVLYRDGKLIDEYSRFSLAVKRAHTECPEKDILWEMAGANDNAAT